MVKDSCDDVELAVQHALSFMTDIEYYRNKTGGECIDVPPQKDTICLCPQNKRSVVASLIGELHINYNYFFTGLLDIIKFYRR